MQVSQEVISVLDQGRCEGEKFFMEGQLDRKLYTAVNKVLVAAGGKWNRGAKAHLFSCDATDAISDIILTGKVVDAKREFDFFETPPEVVKLVMNVAQIQTNQSVLEPNAGGGNLAFAAKLEGGNVTCVELQENLIPVLDAADFECVMQGDFLEIDWNGYVFDRIVMNPPFGKQADIKHVSHALDMLAAGGRLVAIMSAGVEFRENALTVAFRERVAAMGGTIERLPSKSFKSSGTNVETVLVTVQKDI